MTIEIINQVSPEISAVYLISNIEEAKTLLQDNEYEYLSRKAADKSETITINRYQQQLIFVVLSEEINSANLEKARTSGATIANFLNKEKIAEVNVSASASLSEFLHPFCEGLILTNYQFLKYKGNPEPNSLETLKVVGLSQVALNELTVVQDAVFAARDMINEPVSFMNAEKLAETATNLLKNTGATVAVFNKEKIVTENMGGLLAVNRGSIDPPTFTIIEWKPENATNAQPVALVGKGVVYDTGGLSLKPTPNSMDSMKSDMSGAAAIISTMYAISTLKLPLHVMAFIPATDNRPDGNAYTPGDIIKMYDGTTVEIRNTDAEGRMILADAVAYANQFNPEFTLTMATLTGAAAMAIGAHGVVGMGNANEQLMQQIQQAGDKVYERVAVLPFWDEYGKAIKSDIADIKNLGDREGGAISAGKFLAHFCKTEFIHVDIAGPAFINKSSAYRSAGGTGVGIRLLIEFLKSL